MLGEGIERGGGVLLEIRLQHLPEQIGQSARQCLFGNDAVARVGAARRLPADLVTQAVQRADMDAWQSGVAVYTLGHHFTRCLVEDHTQYPAGFYSAPNGFHHPARQHPRLAGTRRGEGEYHAGPGVQTHGLFPGQARTRVRHADRRLVSPAGSTTAACSTSAAGSTSQADSTSPSRQRRSNLFNTRIEIVHDITPAEPYDLSNSILFGHHPVQLEPVVADKLPAVDLHRNGAIVRIAIMRAAIMRAVDQRVDTGLSQSNVEPVMQACPRKSFVHHDFHGGQPGFPRRRQRL